MRYTPVSSLTSSTSESSVVSASFTRKALDYLNSSLVAQFGVCDVGDEIPSDAIGRMGVGFYRPVEGHLVAE